MVDRLIFKLTMLFVAILTTSALSARELQNSDTLKVMSYNIWNGFEWGKDKEREKLFVEYINNESPDIFAMQELCGFTEKKLIDLADKMGYRYSAIVKEEGYPVGVVSKEPIEVISKLVDGYGHGLLHVRTFGYDILITHLNPFDSNIRLEQANNIVRYMESHNLTKRVMLMGDLNSHSPFDACYSELNSRQLYIDRKAENLRNGRFDYSVISRFISYPLIDACQKYVRDGSRETYPTLAFWDKNRSIQDRVVERIDYIFVTDDLEQNLINAQIQNRGGVDYLSDHYPVVIKLKK